jgi:long-chain fatty acid transport protein
MARRFVTGSKGAQLCGVALAVASAGTAHAAGFALKEQSAQDQGASFAGASARADDPSTLFFNPAGMTRLPGYQVSVSGSMILPQGNLDSGLSTINTPAGRVSTGGTVGNNAISQALLGSLYATARLSPEWSVGVAATVPYGLTTKYDTDSVARYYALTSYLRTYNITPSVAYKPIPELSIAAGLQIQVADARLSNAIDFGTIGAGLRIPGFRPGQRDGIASLKGDDTAFGWQVGLLYEPVPGTRLGFDYRSAVFHTLTGSINFQGVPAPLTAVPTFRGGSLTAKLATPDVYSFGLSQDVGDVTLLAQFDYTMWSRFRNLLATWPTGSSLTVENWTNSGMVSVGADWRVTPEWTLRSGIAYDQTPVQLVDRTPRIADADRYWLSVGATWKPTSKIAVSAAYTHVFLDSAQVNLFDQGPGTPNFTRGNLTAKYSGQINILSLQGTLSF